MHRNRRALPQVERLAAALPGSVPQTLRVAAAREVIDAARRAGDDGDVPGFDSLFDFLRDQAAELLAERAKAKLHPVINATGVLLHTNLGRAPLSSDALAAVTRVASGYSNLEFDLSEGKRGSRYVHSADSLRLLTGAERCLVVNNNAAAVLLTLAGLARGQEVIISRGELVEIGGEFRIPEILEWSGARLREVGTTNRTHLKDYESAIGPETAAIMRVHPSNYRVVGFTAQVPSTELADLAHRSGLYFISDLGSGLLRRDVPAWLGGEPLVADAVREGADVVTFSGDKLLGGPQAGIIAGTAAAVDQLAKSPLLRAVRVDKMTLAALEATLDAYIEGRTDQLPVWEMADATAIDLEQRCHALWAALADLPVKVEVTHAVSTAGGGAAPGSELPTLVVELTPRDIDAGELVRRLARADVPVVARTIGDAVALDLRTVAPADDEALLRSLRASF